MSQSLGSYAEFLARVLRASPVYISLIGGVFISMGTSSYMSVFSAEIIPKRWVELLLSAGLGTLGGIAWSVLALRVDKLQRVALVESPEWVSSDKIWAEVVEKSKFNLTLWFFFAFAFSVASLFVMTTGY